MKIAHTDLTKKPSERPVAQEQLDEIWRILGKVAPAEIKNSPVLQRLSAARGKA